MTNKGGGYPTLGWKKNLEGVRERKLEGEMGRRGEKGDGKEETGRREGEKELNGSAKIFGAMMFGVGDIFLQ